MTELFRQRITCRIDRAKHSRTKTAFFFLNTLQTIHWLFFLHVRADHDGGKQFLMQNYCGIEKWCRENHAHTSLYSKLKTFSIKIIRHVFKWNVEKGTTLTASKIIDKCPTERFSDKFLTEGTDKTKNDQGGAWARLELTEPLKLTQFISCLVPRPHYSPRSTHYGSRGRIRHRNALTEKAW